MGNKPSTLGYFMKRMRDSGYRVEKLFTEYCDSDPRNWTVIIDPGRASVICTYFTNRTDIDDNCFEFYDGGQYLPNYKIRTQSIEVLLENLNKHGVIGKTRDYNEKGIQSVSENIAEAVEPDNR